MIAVFAAIPPLGGSIMIRAVSSVVAPAVLLAIVWPTSTRLLPAFRDRRCRLTYDRGVLEIMSPRLDHEEPADFIGWFIHVLIEELQLHCRPGGSVTLRKRRKKKGLEGDKC